MSDPYPFEGEDEDEIAELDLDGVDRFDDERITVGELVGEHESWRFGHVIVDEAQDLTAMQWRMVMRRVRGRSLTIVGDLAQRTAGDIETWRHHLPPELAGVERLDLSINYRSPSEIHSLAEKVLAEFAPGVEPSRSLRSTGVHPRFLRVSQLEPAIAETVGRLQAEPGGQIAVISADALDSIEESDGLHMLTPRQAKGLEFDSVVLIEPAEIVAGRGGAALLYIALTRATQRLVVLHRGDLPDILGSR